MMDADLIRQIAAVAVVFGILGAAVWLLGRLRGATPLLPARRRSGCSRMEVIEKTRVTPQQTLLLLRVGSRGLVVAVHPAGCTVLDSQPIAELSEEGHIQ